MLVTAEAALADAGLRATDLTGIGITNQRETTVVWERSTGRPVHPAIVWQDRRTAERCRELPSDLVRARTGLVPDPYFSATKLEWILARAGVPQSQLAFGTVDAWLVWNLTGGNVHATDLTNASRTMLLDLEAGAWDDELLGLFSIDRALLPTVVPSSGVVAEASLLGATLPVAGIAGDQQAALFGQACFSAGDAKVTYGTGSFVLANIGETGAAVADGLLKTAAATAGGERHYAAEGAVLVAGAALQWLRDGLAVIASAAESEELALSVASSDGVVFVPALTGLGSPYWDPDARGLISGITRGTTRAHLVRAALEAIAHQVADVLDVLPVEVGVLRADGGASANGFLMQLQADLPAARWRWPSTRRRRRSVQRPSQVSATGVWRDTQEIASLVRRGARHEPRLSLDETEAMRQTWRLAVRRALLR